VRFEIELDAEEARPGDKVTGVARATDDERSRRVYARLIFRESVAHVGRSGTSVPPHPVAELDPVNLHEGDLAEGQELRFELALPEGALRTYSGAVGRLGWYVEVVSDEPGFDSRGEAEVIVGPPARAAGAGAANLGIALSVS
jgi:hypothetical protein